jgi:hypothetical protein
MEDIDVWRSAHQFMKMHGDDAVFVAANLADARLADGDMDGCRIWTRIVAAINELSRQKPSSTEHVN